MKEEIKSPRDKKDFKEIILPKIRLEEMKKFCESFGLDESSSGSYGFYEIFECLWNCWKTGYEEGYEYYYFSHS